MLNLFLKVAKVLNRDFNIIPVLYGSFGLQRILNLDLVCDDIDILVPEELIKIRWNELQKEMNKMHFILENEEEHEFHRKGDKVAFAQEEELFSFAGVNAKLFIEEEINDIKFRTLSLQDFLKVYEQSKLDGYRVSKGKQDMEKIKLILEAIPSER